MGYCTSKIKTKKMTKKKSNQIPRKKIPKPATTTQSNPKNPSTNPSTTTKKFATYHNFFLQVMNKILERKKNNQKTKQAREKEIMFLFLTPRFRKKDYN